VLGKREDTPPPLLQQGSVLLEAASKRGQQNQLQENQVVCKHRTSSARSQNKTALLPPSPKHGRGAGISGCPETGLPPVQGLLFWSAGKVLGEQNTTVSVPAGTTCTFYPISALKGQSLQAHDYRGPERNTQNFVDQHKWDGRSEIPVKLL